LTLPEQADLAWKLGADVNLAIAAEIVRPGGKFTSVSTATTSVRHVHSAFVPTVVVPKGHKLADLLFKVAAQRLRSHVDATVFFDQVGDAVSSRNDDSRRIVVVR
jgi:hypothetical protein